VALHQIENDGIPSNEGTGDFLPGGHIMKNAQDDPELAAFRTGVFVGIFVMIDEVINLKVVFQIPVFAAVFCGHHSRIFCNMFFSRSQPDILFWLFGKYLQQGIQYFSG
jgi:hypothetical protein